MQCTNKFTSMYIDIPGIMQRHAAARLQSDFNSGISVYIVIFLYYYTYYRIAIETSSDVVSISRI